jgi:hypothetical protein
MAYFFHANPLDPAITRSMPVKKTNLSDAERAKRIRETALKIETSNDPESFERAFKKVVPSKSKAPAPKAPPQ